jgi:SNF2-related domain
MPNLRRRRRAAADAVAASAVILRADNSDNGNDSSGNRRSPAAAASASISSHITRTGAAVAATAATTTAAASTASTGRRAEEDGSKSKKRCSSSPRKRAATATATTTSAVSSCCTRTGALKQPPQQPNINNKTSVTASATTTITTTNNTNNNNNNSSSIISSTIDYFPDTIDPTILPTTNNKLGAKKTNKNKNHVAVTVPVPCVKDLFPQQEDATLQQHGNVSAAIAVAMPLSRHQGTLWMSTLGAHAAARHCLPELRKLGVVKRKLLLLGSAAAPGRSSPCGRSCRASTTKNKSNDCNNNNNNNTVPPGAVVSLVQLFQQEHERQEQEQQQQQQRKEKTTKYNTPTLKMSKTMAQSMPKAKGDQLALESYLRHGEAVPSASSASSAASSSASSASAAPVALLEEQLMREVYTWHGGALTKGHPGFTTKRAWFDRHGQLLRLGCNHLVSISPSGSSDNTTTKRTKTTAKNRAQQQIHDETVAITTTVTQLLDFMQRGILHDDVGYNKTVRVLQRQIPVDTLTVLQSLQELASPEGGLYNVPLIVSIPILKQQQASKSNSSNSVVVELEIAIYCHRLLFECDYANDLLVVMSALDRDSCRVLEPLLPPPAKPDKPVFESDASRTVVVDGSKKKTSKEKNDGKDDDDDDDDDDLSCCTRDENELSPFSKQGLLKLMESKGNDISEWPAIQSKLAPYFQIQLMLHQVHGICWMMQMEETIRKASPRHGLNSLLWEVRQFSDGHGIYYYSPVLGQIRLHLEKSPFHEPRPISGGLLCDMVGLGKTVQVLALVCATTTTVAARDNGDAGDNDQDYGLVDASGTSCDDDCDMTSSNDGSNKGRQKGDDDNEEEDSDDDFSQYSRHATLVVVTPALVTQVRLAICS